MFTSKRVQPVKHGHELEDMMIDCTFQGRQCFPDNFTGWNHGTYGRCYTIFGPNNEEYPSFVGPSFGLSLTLFIEEKEYLPRVIPASGYRVVVHPDVYPPFPEDLGFNISPGQDTAVAVKQLKVEHQPLPYDSVDCGLTVAKNPFKFKFDRKWSNILAQSGIKTAVNFTNQACTKSCYLERLYESCGCIDASMITREHITHLHLNETIKACDMTRVSELRCVKETTISLNRNGLCDSCVQPCFEEAYILSVTSGLWPRSAYIEQMKDTWARTLPKSGIGNMTDLQIMSQIAKFDVFFGDLNYETITETASMDIWDMASTVGGTLGLYGGLSFLTMCEFFELALRIITKRTPKN